MTEIDICNLALVKVGANPIGSFADGTRQARDCSLWYPAARDALLRSHPWSWARNQLVLPIGSFVPLNLAFKPNPWFQSEIIFTGSYPLPADCIRVYRAAPYNYNFRIVGRNLFTDELAGVDGLRRRSPAWAFRRSTLQRRRTRSASNM